MLLPLRRYVHDFIDDLYAAVDQSVRIPDIVHTNFFVRHEMDDDAHPPFGNLDHIRHDAVFMAYFRCYILHRFFFGQRHDDNILTALLESLFFAVFESTDIQSVINIRQYNGIVNREQQSSFFSICIQKITSRVLLAIILIEC